MLPTPEQPAVVRTIAVLGAGYVGLTTAAGFAYLGHRVRVGDADPTRIEDLAEGRVPIAEPGIEDLLGAAREAGRISFHQANSVAVEGAEAVFLAVPTPEGPGGSVDLGFVAAAIRSVAGRVGAAVPVVIKSSVPPGSAPVIRRYLDDAGLLCPLVINPEFLQEGRAVEGVLRPYRVIIGGSDAAAVATIAALHEPLGAPIVRTDASSAELAKYAANAYLATRITFVNSIAHLAEEFDADIDAVLESLSFDPRIGGHYLRPGPGYGGSCFPKDLRALVKAAADRGHDLRMLRSVVETNDAQLDRVVGKVREGLGSIDGKVVGLLGLAYKDDTDDTRSSPALALAERLLAEGAVIRAYDPVATIDRAGMVLVGDEVAAASGADALLIATEWPRFSELDLGAVAKAMRGRLIVDARNMLDRDAAVAAGFDYRGLGR